MLLLWAGMWSFRFYPLTVRKCLRCGNVCFCLFFLLTIRIPSWPWCQCLCGADVLHANKGQDRIRNGMVKSQFSALRVFCEFVAAHFPILLSLDLSVMTFWRLHGWCLMGLVTLLPWVHAFSSGSDMVRQFTAPTPATVQNQFCTECSEGEEMFWQDHLFSCRIFLLLPFVSGVQIGTKPVLITKGLAHGVDMCLNNILRDHKWSLYFVFLTGEAKLSLEQQENCGCNG